ncbi:hypothetical protein J5681_07880 [bacterium]|nr:hypothetical protein [bacterium]
MKIFVFMLLAALVFGCSDAKHDTVELKISYTLEEGRTCQTYLADHFLVTVYDSAQRKISEKKISCDTEEPGMKLVVEKDSYYVSVVLRSSDNMWQSYGAARAEVDSDTEINILMKTYQGGMIFKWDTADCGRYTLSLMTVDMFSEGEPVNAVLWGEEVKMENLQLPCSAGQLEVINIPPEPTYTATFRGYRKSLKGESRTVYEIPEFVSGHGQNKKVNIADYRVVLVSDMKVSWEFDSKSIDSCETAGITKVKAVLVSEEGYAVYDEQECDNKFSDFYLYEITHHSYTLFVYGITDKEEVLFESSLEVGEIEPGSVGKNILENKIFLKEK